jgi:ankyrin repeat protein
MNDSIFEELLLDVCRNETDIVIVMAKNFPEILDRVGDSGLTMLHLASYGGHVELVKGLLDLGANVHQKSLDGLDALKFAVAKQRMDVIDLLLSRGAAFMK